MKKERYPLLEFDPSLESIINPSYIQTKFESIPSKLIVCFFHEVIDALEAQDIIQKTHTIGGENSYNIYVSKDKNIAYIKGLVGAPACGAQLEECIALGAKTIMFAGGGGVLNSELAVGKLVVIDSAIRDEGVSYHYAPASREIAAQPEMIAIIESALQKSDADYVVGKTWTTDALFRETPKKIALRKSEGALIVEMEQAALLAISAFRHVRYGAIVYCGDDVSKDKHDTRSWRNRQDIRKGLVVLCETILSSID